MKIYNRYISVAAAAAVLLGTVMPASAAYQSREEIAFSLRPMLAEDTAFTSEGNTVYVPLDEAGGSLVRFGMYIEAEYADISFLQTTVMSDSELVRFTEEGYQNPTAEYTTEAVTYTLSDGTTFSTKLKPYCFGRINGSGVYRHDSMGVMTKFDTENNQISTQWTYGYENLPSRSASFLGAASDEFSFIEFEVELDEAITEGTYTLSFQDNVENTYIVSDDGDEDGGMVTTFPTLKNAKLVVYDDKPTAAPTEPETKPVTEPTDPTEETDGTEAETNAPTEPETLPETKPVTEPTDPTEETDGTEAETNAPTEPETLPEIKPQDPTEETETTEAETQASTGSKDLRGDVDGNGVVDAVDASYILVYAAYAGSGNPVDWDAILGIAGPSETAPTAESIVPETTEPETTEPETTEPETTEPETTEPETTEPLVEIPSSKQLDVKCILQNDAPSLPTGCEATALTIALNYDGFAVSKNTVADNYLPKMYFTDSFGVDFRYIFPGNPADYSGYGCYAPAVKAAADAYFAAMKNDSWAEDISGTEFEDLFAYIHAGRPVIFNATMGMVAPESGSSWTTPQGESVTWLKHEHCLVLTGYDKDADIVYVADPLKGNVTYSLSLVKQRYEQMGKSAVILHPSTGIFAQANGIEDGAVYTLQNLSSGKYLTVCGGRDENTANVIQADGDGSISQQFRITYRSDSNSYVFGAMCSSDGNNRVLDIVKTGGCVSGGCNVEIYNPTDAAAQEFILLPQSDGSFRIASRSSRSAYVAVTDGSTGSSDGTVYRSAGNVVMQFDSGTADQKWILTKV